MTSSVELITIIFFCVPCIHSWWTITVTAGMITATLVNLLICLCSSFVHPNLLPVSLLLLLLVPLITQMHPCFVQTVGIYHSISQLMVSVWVRWRSTKFFNWLKALEFCLNLCACTKLDDLDFISKDLSLRT